MPEALKAVFVSRKCYSLKKLNLSPATSQVGGGTFSLRGDLWIKNTFDVQANRDLTVRSGMAATHSRGSSPRVHNVQECEYTLLLHRTNGHVSGQYYLQQTFRNAVHKGLSVHKDGLAAQTE